MNFAHQQKNTRNKSSYVITHLFLVQEEIRNYNFQFDFSSRRSLFFFRHLEWNSLKLMNLFAADDDFIQTQNDIRM